jgi:hypothetical protein
MTSHYGDDRHWVAIRQCPGCGADHPEFEFKREKDGVYRGRCFRGKITLEYDPNSDAIMATQTLDAMNG